MKEDLRYSASDCFDTFPFPQSDPRTIITELESIGEKLYETRARYMVETQQGLTATYNQLKDTNCNDAPILQLRELHIAMDQAVLKAYRWADIVVPPFTTPSTTAEEKALEAFQDEVIDRLFVLNAQRAGEEKALGLMKDKLKGPKRTQRKSAPDEEQIELTLSAKGSRD